MKKISSVNTILFICYGNICRSPAAEYYFNYRAMQEGSNIRARSAGIAARRGIPAAEEMIRLLEHNGINMQAHTARPVSRLFIDDADIILAMEENHANVLRERFPDATKKIQTFLAYTNGTDNEVPDPYMHSYELFEKSFSLIQQGIDTLFTLL